MELNFKEFGQGPPLVILHGLFGTLDNWQTIARKLSETHSVYIPDLRNHGRSPHEEEITYPLMADDVQHFMESNWLYKAQLIGHSMGGKVAMQLALHNPDMVERLVVVDIGPKAYPGGHEVIFKALFDLDLEHLQQRSEAETFLMDRLNRDSGVVQFLMKNLSRSKEGLFEWKMNLAAIYRHYSDILAPVEGDPFGKPTLFIRGENSGYIQDSDWPDIRKLFPEASLETVAGAGHWVHAEKPAELMALLSAFLQ